jgi:hypothetical protein
MEEITYLGKPPERFSKKKSHNSRGMTRMNETNVSRFNRRRTIRSVTTQRSTSRSEQSVMFPLNQSIKNQTRPSLRNKSETPEQGFRHSANETRAGRGQRENQFHANNFFDTFGSAEVSWIW